MTTKSCCVAAGLIHLHATPASGGRISLRHEQNQRRDLGKRLVRTRLATRPQAEDALAYRRPGGCLANASPYYDCTFLDEETVLCIDQLGFDAIRLKRSNISQGGADQENRALATNIRDVAHRSAAQPFLATTSLFRGQAFATGLPTGEFRVFCTEHASTWGQRHGLALSAVSQRIPPTPANPNYESIMLQNNFVTSAWRVPGPQRRYRCDTVATLQHQLENPGCVSRRSMEEIHGWNNANDYGDIYSHYSPGAVQHWAFRETASTVVALHMGFYNDNMCLRVLDDRVCQNPSRNQLGVPLDVPKDQCLSGCCFVNDTTIATGQSGVASGERIQLWDLRKMTRGKAVSNVALPSYPREVAHKLKPTGDALHLRSDFSGKIVHLQSSSNESALMVTTSEENASARSCHEEQIFTHWMVELGGQERVVSVAQQFASSSLESPAFGVDQSCTTLAAYHEKNEIPYISLYDVDKARQKYVHVRPPAQGDKRRRKRARDELSTIAPFASIQPKIQDEYGLQGSLIKIRSSPSGMSLIGISNDSDLYSWRATM